MRMALTAFFAAALFCAGDAAAQIAAQTPNLQLPNNQPTVLSAPAVEARRVQILRAAGVQPPPGGLSTATTLSVNTPTVPGARLNFHNLAFYLPSVASGGTATMRPNAGPGDISYVDIRFRADARVRYIVDCVVTGQATTYQFERLTGPRTAPRETRETTTVTRSEGRVATLVPPAAVTGDQTLYLKSREQWWFHQCEIVPVR